MAPEKASTEAVSTDHLSTELTEQRRAQIRKFSKLMDSRFRIPGTKQTFGIDPILGLLPGGGDAASLIISAGIVIQAARFGARGSTLVLMLLNLALDAITGTVPILGTVFDIFYKANNRNVALLERHVVDPTLTRAQIRRRVILSIAVIVVFTIMLLLAIVAITAWLIAWIF
ncbi:DUF4112 domain-containing protein [Lolliginicoccus suaedae]|uniref:DUF4112 domain-containing protein n=1 Tax=Lolliginicoccus suaedae TaxID=2605429 RepID=UPI0011ECC8AF|nr:DUF4112 domain-containing protein [Lolliginicoccus suaedae]